MPSLKDSRIDEIESHTVALVHYDRQQRPDSIASGILVSVNGYPYLATAGHCVHVSDGTSIRLAFGQETSHPESDWQDLVGTAVYNRNERSPVDAAFAPVRSPKRLIAFGKSFYKVPDNFPARLVLGKGSTVFTVGYPDAMWEPLTDITPGSLEIGGLVYRTSILATTAHSYEYTYDPGTVVETFPGDSELPADPTGVSGSGLWMIPPAEYEPVRLIGINTEHVSSSRKCVAMFLEAWAAFFSHALKEKRVLGILEEAFQGVTPVY